MKRLCRAEALLPEVFESLHKIHVTQCYFSTKIMQKCGLSMKNRYLEMQEGPFKTNQCRLLLLIPQTVA